MKGLAAIVQVAVLIQQEMIVPMAMSLPVMNVEPVERRKKINAVRAL